MEIGTSSGYQTAILSELVHEVFTIEIVQELRKRTKKLSKALLYDNVAVRIAKGHEG